MKIISKNLYKEKDCKYIVMIIDFNGMEIELVLNEDGSFEDVMFHSILRSDAFFNWVTEIEEVNESINEELDNVFTTERIEKEFKTGNKK